MKLLLALAAVALLCAACAQGGGPDASGPGSGRISMYGTIDEGVSYHSK
ncbi:hypothetical protein [Paraburkholderia megapolitana]